MSDSDQALIRRDAEQFYRDYLSTTLERAKVDDQNPVVMIFALLDAAMKVAEECFPEQAENLYVSATQLVFEAHQEEESGH